MRYAVALVIQKLRAVQAQIRHLQASDFPYDDSKLALGQLHEVLSQQEALIRQAVDGGAAEDVLRACRSANAKIVEIHPLLGILLRSTNVRNAFETYGPLLAIARKLLPGDARLILSSEWAFSPFTYPSASEDLRNFVLIGLPASEATNALIVPTAGHELGHSVWAHTSIGRELSPTINENVVSQYVRHVTEFRSLFRDDVSYEVLFRNDDALANLTSSCRIAVRQAEEIFCDALGVFLFGNSYIDAFDYLVWPSLGEYRSELYPEVERRRSYMKRVARKCGYKIRRDNKSHWLEQQKPLSTYSRFAVQMADLACDALFDDIADKAIEHCDSRGADRVDGRNARVIAKLFRECLPCEAQSVGDILEGAWIVLHQCRAPGDGDREISSIDGGMLNDLVFKSMEVSEYKGLDHNGRSGR